VRVPVAWFVVPFFTVSSGRSVLNCSSSVGVSRAGAVNCGAAGVGVGAVGAALLLLHAVAHTTTIRTRQVFGNLKNSAPRGGDSAGRDHSWNICK
jgi:hypothetical protein